MASVLMEQAERRAKRLSENYDQWGWLGGYEDVIDRIRQPGKELYAPMSTVNDRRYGHNWPFWRTWAEHARLRASARLLCTLSPIASGALSGLRAYVVGNGYNYRAHTEQLAPEGVVGAVQSVIDEFVRESDWCQVEQELFERSRRDGECFLLHTVAERRLAVEIIEPEQVQSPPGEDQDYTYGIETRGRQTHKPRRYNVVEDPGGLDGEEYTPEELHHLKVNVDAKVKRGLTDFSYDTHDAIRTAGRLVDHVGQGAAIQASIALIRQHETASPSQVSDFVQAASDYDRYDPVSGRQEYSERYAPGKILDIDKGQNYVVPPFATNVGGYIEVIQGVLRAVAVRWNAPEWLISADASGTNYASSVTAESPFVKRCYQEQERYKAYFLRTIRRAVQLAAQNGRIRAYGRTWSWEEVQAIIDIQVEAPTVETRNTAQDASTNRTYIEAGVKSVQTTQQELGLDSDLEASNIAAWKARMGGATGGESKPGEAVQGDPAAALRGSVGGSQALMGIQQAYYQGQIPRDACIANARIVFGFSTEDAEALFPEIQPTKLNPKQVGQPAGPGGDGGNPLASLMGGAGDAGDAGDNTEPSGPEAGDGNPMSDLLFGDEPAPETQPDEDRPDTGLTEAERKDKLGRRMCFDDDSGRRVPCAPKASEKGKEKADTKQPAVKGAKSAKSATPAQVATLVKDLLGKDSVSKDDLLGLLGHLVSMKPTEVREALKGLGLPEPSAEVLALSDAALEGVDRASALAAKHKDGSLTADDLAGLGMGDLRALGVLVGVKGRSKDDLRGKILGTIAKDQSAGKQPKKQMPADGDSNRISRDAKDEEPSQPADRQLDADILGEIRGNASDFKPISIANLMGSLQKRHPGANKAQIKKRILQLYADGQLRLDPYTSGVGNLSQEEAENSIYMDGEVKHFIYPGNGKKKTGDSYQQLMGSSEPVDPAWKGDLSKEIASSSSPMSLPELYGRLRKKYPGLSVLDFQQELLDSYKRGGINLHPWTDVLHSLPDGANALPFGKNGKSEGVAFWVSAGKPVDKPAPKPEPQKPAAKPVTASDVADSGTLGAAWSKLRKKGTVKIPELYDEIAKTYPGLTQEQFHKILQELHDDDRINLEAANSPNAELRAGEGIQSNRGLLFYVLPGENPPKGVSR